VRRTGIPRTYSRRSRGRRWFGRAESILVHARYFKTVREMMQSAQLVRSRAFRSRHAGLSEPYGLTANPVRSPCALIETRSATCLLFRARRAAR